MEQGLVRQVDMVPPRHSTGVLWQKACTSGVALDGRCPAGRWLKARGTESSRNAWDVSADSERNFAGVSARGNRAWRDKHGCRVLRRAATSRDDDERSDARVPTCALAVRRPPGLGRVLGGHDLTLYIRADGPGDGSAKRDCCPEHGEDSWGRVTWRDG